MKVSNPEKLIFPSFTKADLVGHYEAVAERMLPFLAGRPLTLQRFPKGVEAKGFMQKNAGRHFPSSIERHEVSKRGGGVTTYPVIYTAGDLAYLANQGTVTFHMWTSRAAAPGTSDWMILDLDPADGDVAGARLATLAVADVLAEFNLSGFPQATGSSGFHVWVPINPTPTAEVSEASRAIAGLASIHHPDELTTEFLKKKRHGRVFVDWLRNTPSATTVVPFSLRPKIQAPVAVPLTWAELPSAVPDGWTLGNTADRVAPDIQPQSVPTEDILASARAEGVDLDTPHDRFGRR